MHVAESQLHFSVPLCLCGNPAFLRDLRAFVIFVINRSLEILQQYSRIGMALAGPQSSGLEVFGDGDVVGERVRSGSSKGEPAPSA
jgi:hypothetical protein